MRRTIAICATIAVLTAMGAPPAFAGASKAGAFAKHSKYRLLRLDGYLVKFGAPRLGAPARVSYAFADRLIQDKDARNCKSIRSLDSVAEGSGLTSRTIELQATAAFRMWQAAAGVIFTRTEDAEHADILIGAQAVPRGYAFTNVHTEQVEAGKAIQPDDGGLDTREPVPTTHGLVVGSGIATISQSTICLNPRHDWKIGFAKASEGYDLRYTFIHEIGHAVGLDHYFRRGQIMNFRYTEEIDRPQAGDINGIRRLYGLPHPAVAAK